MYLWPAEVGRAASHCSATTGWTGPRTPSSDRWTAGPGPHQTRGQGPRNQYGRRPTASTLPPTSAITTSSTTTSWGQSRFAIINSIYPPLYDNIWANKLAVINIQRNPKLSKLKLNQRSFWNERKSKGYTQDWKLLLKYIHKHYKTTKNINFRYIVELYIYFLRFGFRPRTEGLTWVSPPTVVGGSPASPPAAAEASLVFPVAAEVYPASPPAAAAAAGVPPAAWERSHSWRGRRGSGWPRSPGSTPGSTTTRRPLIPGGSTTTRMQTPGTES